MECTGTQFPPMMALEVLGKTGSPFVPPLVPGFLVPGTDPNPNPNPNPNPIPDLFDDEDLDIRGVQTYPNSNSNSNSNSISNSNNNPNFGAGSMTVEQLLEMAKEQQVGGGG